MDTELGHCLLGTLNPDGNVRIKAELRISELLPHHDTGTILASILASGNVDISMRQHSASIILRRYTKEHWSPFFGGFKGVAPSPEIKNNIRCTVFQCLTDPLNKIRSAAANVLSLIANSDWPDEYPDLLNNLLGLLSSQSPEAVHGAMQVFTEFIKEDLTEDQILPIIRLLLPVLMNILGDPVMHSPVTRARAIAVFRHCLHALFMVKDQHPQAIKEAIDSVLPQWIEAFKVLTSQDPSRDVADGHDWEPLLLRIQIFKTLINIQTIFSRSFKSSAHLFLDIALNHLQTLLPAFIQYYLDPNTSPPPSSEDDETSLTRLASSLIDFVSNIAFTASAKTWFEPMHLEGLIIAIFRWIQMTSEDEDTWGSNANLFVAHEDEETQEYNLRVAGLDLISGLLDHYPTPTVAALQHASNCLVQEADQARQQGSKEWWRPLEAALAALGSQAETMFDLVEEEEAENKPKSFQVEPLLLNVVPSLLTLSECPFLQGRCFVFASQYCKALPASIASHYLEASLTVIEASEPGIPVKVSAVKAIRNFCTRMDPATVVPVAPRIIKDLGPFLLVTTEDTLVLVLESVLAVIEVDKGRWLDTELASMLSQAILEVWTKNIKDPITLSILDDLLSSLAGCPTRQIYQAVVSSSLPVLCQAIGQPQNESWVLSSAVDLISSLARGASHGNLGDGFFATIAPNLFACLEKTHDQETLENAVVLLTYIVRKDPSQVIGWLDGQGQSGLTKVLALIGRVLAPENEPGGLMIGDLIIHLLRNVGEAILPVLPDLIRAMTNRMSTAKTAGLLQSLIIPLAYLIHVYQDSVLTVLESFEVEAVNPSKTGLDVFIATWIENAETIQGLWSQRVSVLALSALLLSGRHNLQNIQVKGDMILKPETSDVIVTRSRAKKTPHEFELIPFPVKALKLLLEEFHIDGEAAAMAARSGDVASDDGNSEWADSDNEDRLIQGFKPDEFVYLSEILGGKSGFDDDEDGAGGGLDDEDLKQDSIYTMDMKAHLISFLRQCAQQDPNRFSSLVDRLNTQEMLVVQKVIEGS